MIILGIDPGISGGLVLVRAHTSGHIIESGMRMPTVRCGKKKIVDAREINLWLIEVPRIDVAVVESVHAMPKQGVSSSFSFGRNTGAVESLALIHARVVNWVTPQLWKKHFGLSKIKKESIILAQEIYGTRFYWDRLADDGVAEAALMAQWYLDTNNSME
jgi:crossover junction endodeoxyribonuclease RuvC